MADPSRNVFRPGLKGRVAPRPPAAPDDREARDFQALVREQVKREVRRELAERGIDPDPAAAEPPKEEPPKEEPKLPLWFWVVTSPIWLPIFLMLALPHLLLAAFFLGVIGVLLWMLPQVSGF